MTGVRSSETLGLADMWGFSLTAASPVAWAVLILLALYWVAAISLWRAGRRWSPISTASFTLGCLAVFAVTGLAVNEHANSLVSALLFQQITLLVVAPPFLLIGRPGTLLLKAAPHRGLGRVALRAALGAYRSRAAQVLLHPVVAIIISLLAFPWLYLTDAISLVMAFPGGHDIALLCFLVLGVIGGAPLWSLDPLPRSPSYVVRFVDVLLEIQIHAVFGLLLLSSAEPMFAWFEGDPEGWGISRLIDQAIAGGLVWSYGELPLLIVLIITLSKWRTTETRKARLRQAEDDAALDEYNEYLAAQRAYDEER